MGTLLDLASLVVVPSGYKEDKIYSVVPTDGSGDLDFTRASNATRVNSAGLIEKVRTNINTYSEDFTATGGWGALFGATITRTANYGTAPDGTTTSTRIVFSSGSQIYSKTISGLTGNIGTFSLWIKGTAGETIAITYGGISDKLVTLGSGWTRFNTDGNSATNNTIYINTFLSATARDIEVWGGQVEFGDIATDYIPTTTAAVSVGMTANVPRLDYLGSSCPSLLLEPQRTNLVTFSEQFDNAAWTQNATVTANSTISPSGYQDADTLTDSTGAFLDVRRSFTITASTAYTFSIFVKKTTGALTNYAGVGFSAGGGVETGYAIFNTTTGVVNFADVAGGFVLSAKSTSYGDYYRFEMTFTTGQTSLIVLIYPALSQNGTTLSSDAQGSNVFWGAQLEAGNYATSYIPSLSTSVTRVADAASKTGISSLIGQTEGTIFLDLDFTNINSTQVILSLHDSANNKRLEIWANNNNIYGFIGGSVNITVGSATILNGKHKIALAYKQSGDHAFYVDGVQIGTSSTAYTIAALTALSYDYWATGFNPTAGINQTLLFKIRLSNTELAQLTTI
jgi:hypothetical protein